jgi:hypothetical protein
MKTETLTFSNFSRLNRKASGVFRAVGGANADIFSASNAVVRTLFIPTEKGCQIVHDCPSEEKLLKMQNINNAPKE